MLRIGSDISQIIHTPYATGVQRVVVETHKYLKKIAVDCGDVITGVNLSTRKPTTRNQYIWTDPLIANPTMNIRNLDVLIALDGNIKFIASSLKQKNRHLKIFSLLNDILPITNPEYFNFSNRPYFQKEFKFYVLKLLRISDYVIVTSNQTRNALLQLNWSTPIGGVKVIPLGAFETEVSPKKNQTNTQNSIIRLICVNTLEPRKGHDDILDALEILNKDKIRFILNIIGKEGWDVSSLVYRIKSHVGYGKYLFWESNLSDQEIQIRYGQSDIALNASRNEGFGLTIEEGLAHGIKVIARNIPVFTERQNPNLYFFNGGALELANKINEVKDFTFDHKIPVRSMKDFASELYRFIYENVS